MVHPPGRPPFVFVLPDVTTIGSHADCNLRLDEPCSSRQHCRITRDVRGFVITDLQSTRGTFINGPALRGEHVLVPGDIVHVGDHQLHFD